MSKNVKKVGDYEYAISGDKIVFNGPTFMSWHHEVNKLDEECIIAVVIAAASNPFPMGTGKKCLEVAGYCAAFALRTDGGRQMSLEETDHFGPLSPAQTAACNVLLTSQRAAYKAGISTLAVLRLLLSVRTFDSCNAPHDSYLRLALGTLEQY